MQKSASGDYIITVKESKTLICGGIFWTLFGLALLFVLIPWQITDETPQSGTSARYIPEAVSYLLVLCGVLLTIDGLKNKDIEDQRVYTFNLHNMRLVLYSLLIVSANIIAFDLIGYLIPAMCTLVILMLLYGNRSYVKIAIYSITIPLIIYKFFQMALQMYLP